MVVTKGNKFFNLKTKLKSWILTIKTEGDIKKPPRLYIALKVVFYKVFSL